MARWQFGITTVYHFIFVPLTIGLAPLVAIMQTLWVRTGNERWLRLTKFFGKLLLINFAIGVATGIVQEFQFGMAWSEYSRFVGDVFGAPLAMEALAAFFVESTFLGLWIFGWDKLPKKVHLACIWAVAVATNLSAFFILAANSWMQHPVGVQFNAARARRDDGHRRGATNNTLLAAFPHTISAAFLTAGTFVAGIAAWWMVRLVRAGRRQGARRLPARRRPGVIVMVIAGVGVALTGDLQAKLMFEQQPTKMAAAEALCETTPARLLDPRDRAAGHGRRLRRGHPPDRDPRRPLVPGDRRLRRHRCRAPTAPGGVRGEVRLHRRERRAHQLHPEPRRDLLGLPPDDRLRPRLGGARARGALGHPDGA